MFYKQFSEEDRETFKNISLSTVYIQNASEDDIEELFFRLNNGEPLNAAEKRNAIGGDMNLLIKEIAANGFFSEKLKFKNKRYSHYELAAKFILLEKTQMETGEMYSDLKKKFLDAMVKGKKKMPEAEKEGLAKRVQKNLTILKKVFEKEDELLSKQISPPLYYLFVKVISNEYGHPYLYSNIHKFLENFQVRRLQNLDRPEEERDRTLLEFGRLMQQGTSDLSSLKDRVSILRRFFLEEFTDVELLDKKRQFTPEERYAIWIINGKECSECKKN